ncbi:MAG: hypothetical protein JW895_16640 [Thermoleophilaceae bacterium]|nr:hypothetical protein [Thermoleophilaceae bacterium]
MRTAGSVILWVLAALVALIDVSLIVYYLSRGAAEPGRTWGTLAALAVFAGALAFMAWRLGTRRACPRCGKAVRKGITVCPTCGFDYAAVTSAS